MRSILLWNLSTVLVVSHLLQCNSLICLIRSYLFSSANFCLRNLIFSLCFLHEFFIACLMQCLQFVLFSLKKTWSFVNGPQFLHIFATLLSMNNPLFVRGIITSKFDNTNNLIGVIHG